MVIQNLKELVTNIAVMLVFISAVEIIAPDNKMKKYISFVLGIIFIAVLINPIIKIIKSGDESIEKTISKFEMRASEYEDSKDSQAVFNNEDSALSKQFQYNLNEKCAELLKEKYKNMNFKCETDCSIDRDGIAYTINEIKVYVSSKDVEKVKKVVININGDESETDDYKEIRDYLKEKLQIPEEKIKIYKMEE